MTSVLFTVVIQHVSCCVNQHVVISNFQKLLTKPSIPVVELKINSPLRWFSLNKRKCLVRISRAFFVDPSINRKRPLSERCVSVLAEATFFISTPPEKAVATCNFQDYI